MIITLPPPPPPRKKRLTALVATLLVLPLMLGLPATVTATSTCEAPFQYKGKVNELADDDSDFAPGSARYIVNPTYPHTPCARLCYYYTPVMGQVCPQRIWIKDSDPLPRTPYCSSNPACVGRLTDQQVSNGACDPAEDAWEQGLVAVFGENTELITMNLQHWQKDLDLAHTNYACVPGEFGLR